jgi:uncharacterized lipoprotein
VRQAPLRLSTVVLVAICLAGCGIFGGNRSFHEDSVAGRPLEIPPGLDDPGRANALTIPDGGAIAGGATIGGAPPAGATGTGAAAYAGPAPSGPARVRIEDSVAGAWPRVGLALERSGLGEIVARDESAMTYTVRGQTIATEPVERGFFGRLFGGSDSRAVEAEATRVVRIRPDGEASEAVVEDESGNPADDDLARRLADAIRRRLG